MNRQEIVDTFERALVVLREKHQEVLNTPITVGMSESDIERIRERAKFIMARHNLLDEARGILLSMHDFDEMGQREKQTSEQLATH